MMVNAQVFDQAVQVVVKVLMHRIPHINMRVCNVAQTMGCSSSCAAELTLIVYRSQC
jgi:hypothetical protein